MGYSGRTEFSFENPCSGNCPSWQTVNRKASTVFLLSIVMPQTRSKGPISKAKASKASKSKAKVSHKRKPAAVVESEESEVEAETASLTVSEQREKIAAEQRLLARLEKQEVLQAKMDKLAAELVLLRQGKDVAPDKGADGLIPDSGKVKKKADKKKRKEPESSSDSDDDPDSSSDDLDVSSSESSDGLSTDNEGESSEDDGKKSKKSKKKKAAKKAKKGMTASKVIKLFRREARQLPHDAKVQMRQVLKLLKDQKSTATPKIVKSYYTQLELIWAKASADEEVAERFSLNEKAKKGLTLNVKGLWHAKKQVSSLRTSEFSKIEAGARKTGCAAKKAKKTVSWKWNQPEEKVGAICYKCNEPGHMSYNCPTATPKPKAPKKKPKKP